MNKRVIINVATGEFYCKMQARLVNSFINKRSIDRYISVISSDCDLNDYTKGQISTGGIDLICWKDCLPKGSRSHEESPYGFKVHAIKAAYEMGYTSILWLDSPAYAVKEDISPIFDMIEKKGYYAMSHFDPLERFVGDMSLQAYGWSRNKLGGYNLPSGSCYGFRIDGPMPKDWPMNEGDTELFWDFYFQEGDGMFTSEVNGEIVHRHDEAILALNLIQRGLPIFLFDRLFQSDSPECVIKSGGL